MGAVEILLPRTDYLDNHQDYDLLDSILYSAGFKDDGIVSIGEHAFRQHGMNDAEFSVVPYSNEELPPPVSYGREIKISLYSRGLDSAAKDKLASHGIVFDSFVFNPDCALQKYTIDRRHLSILAKLCLNGVRASKRLIEERAYFRFVDHGRRDGCELADWLATEWECNDYVKTLLNNVEEP